MTNKRQNITQQLLQHGKADVHITKHASERLEERFGIADRLGQKKLAREILKDSEYLGVSKKPNTKKRELDEYEYRKDGKYILLVLDGLRLVTIVDIMESSKPVETSENVRKKFVEDHERRVKYYVEDAKREVDKLTVEMKRMEIELLTNEINFIRAKNPKTRDIISKRIDNLKEKIESISKVVTSHNVNIEVAEGLKVF